MKHPKRRTYAFLAIVFSIAFISTIMFTPLNTTPLQSYSLISYGLPLITEHDQFLMKMAELIPKNAPVLTQNNLFPPLSNRANAYLFPSGVRFPPGVTFSKELELELDKVDFIFVDLKTDTTTFPTILAYLPSQGNFGVYAAADEGVVLKRNFSSLPVLFEPYAMVFNYRSLVLFDGITVNDSESDSGFVLMHSLANKSSTLFWGGPYAFLPPGNYEAVFRMKASNFSEGNLVDLYVSYFPYTILVKYQGTNATGYHLDLNIAANETQYVVASRSLTTSDFPVQNHYNEFTVNFTAVGFGAYEFRGTTVLNNSNIYLDEIKITQTKPLQNISVQVKESYPSG